ncbi:hypothetical protein [Oryzifoliimicrobium ureilyticus]|uniref:hypothetical protein n=1 Tax=Oryzifoliimicrobium ureilyticus TaxID=3113724 RepID=UPI003076038B
MTKKKKVLIWLGSIALSIILIPIMLFALMIYITTPSELESADPAAQRVLDEVAKTREVKFNSPLFSGFDTICLGSEQQGPVPFEEHRYCRLSGHFIALMNSDKGSCAAAPVTQFPVLSGSIDRECESLGENGSLLLFHRGDRDLLVLDK